MEEKKKKIELKVEPASVVVTIIARHKDTALVQYIDDLGARRAYIPESAIQNGKVQKTELDAGVEYGIPWNALLTKNVLVEAPRVCALLRNNGIWTIEDLHKNAGKLSLILAGLMDEMRAQITIKAETFSSQEVKNG